MQKIVQKVLAIAAKEIGVAEQGGNNRGIRVEEYLRAVGLGAGQPWCAAFVSWVMQKGGVRSWPSTGDTWAIRDWAARLKISRLSPAPGDVFLLLGADGNPTHTGFVEAVDGAYIVTIEGNTGGESDTDGDGVHRKRRLLCGCSYVRWPLSYVKQHPASIHVVLRRDGADLLINCRAEIEDGVTRVDLRPVCDAAGWVIETSGLDDGVLVLRPRSA